MWASKTLLDPVLSFMVRASAQADMQACINMDSFLSDGCTEDQCSTCNAVRQPSNIDWYTARSFVSLTGRSMKPQVSFLNSGSRRKASLPEP